MRFTGAGRYFWTEPGLLFSPFPVWLLLHIYRSGVRVVSIVSPNSLQESKQACISQMLNYPFKMRSHKFMSEHLHYIF